LNGIDAEKIVWIIPANIEEGFDEIEDIILTVSARRGAHRRPRKTRRDEPSDPPPRVASRREESRLIQHRRRPNITDTHRFHIRPPTTYDRPMARTSTTARTHRHATCSQPMTHNPKRQTIKRDNQDANLQRPPFTDRKTRTIKFAPRRKPRLPAPMPSRMIADERSRT
jgi:hypothetical protein